MQAPVRDSPGQGSPTAPPSSRGARSSAFRIAATYAIAATLYIAFSDWLLAALVSDPGRQVTLQTWKGAAFVVVTAVLLYSVLASELARREAAEHEALELAERLEARVAERTRALSSSNAALESFSYSVSHDLRAPLRTLYGFSEILLEDYAHQLDEEGKDYARRIRDGARRLDTLIQDLLRYSRIGGIAADAEDVDLDWVVSEVLAQLDREITRRGARVDIRQPLGAVRGHHALVQQVLANLVGNALIYVPPGRQPEVRLTTERRDGWVRIWVADNGVGIAPANHERIFGMFERVDTGDDHPGSGIGLALVKKAVERMGGTIGLESSPGQGSRFWVDLPAPEGERGREAD